MTPILSNGEHFDRAYDQRKERFQHQTLTEAEFERCRKLFWQVYKNGTMSFEDLPVIYDNQEIEWLDRIHLFIDENDLKGEMNIELQSAQGRQSYGVRLDNGLVFNWEQDEAGNLVANAQSRSDTQRVWTIIKGIA